MEEMSYVFSFIFLFFSLPLIFTLHGWPLAFLILSPPLQNFHVVLPTKKCLLCFLSLAIDLCRPFSRWASMACRLVSLFLFLSPALYSKFVDMTTNLVKLNTLDNTDTETISAFRFRLYWLFSCLCFTRRGWLCDFPPSNLELHLGCHTCWSSYFTLVCLWYGRTVARSVYGHVITKFSRMGRLLHFLTDGTPLALFASESSAMTTFLQ